ncbi:protein cueball [Ischnura elegans]|uniref:protein cueball n=1 Tax=Ischnura elegans TaxID=197161 RepID=UPI001ED88ED0|nr:protein cueball [Ischnura elegans]
MHTLNFLALCLLPVFSNGFEMAVGTSRGPTILKPEGKNFTAERIGGYTMEFVNVHAVAVGNRRVFFAYSKTEDDVLVNSMLLDPEQEDDPTFTPVLKKGQGALQVRSMVYNELNDAIYWTDNKKREISMIGVSNDNQNATVLLKFGSEKHLAGIAIDVCHGLLFWTNSNYKSPSLERSYLNGSNQEVIISSDLHLPIALTVDPSGDGRLYWTDTSEGSSFEIETSLLDGSGRATLYLGFYQRPFSIAYVPLGGANSQEGVVLWVETTHSAIWQMEVSNGGKIPGKDPRRIYQLDTALGMVAAPSFNSINPVTCDNSSGVSIMHNLTLTGEGDDRLSEVLEPEKANVEDVRRSTLQEPMTQIEEHETIPGGVEKKDQMTAPVIESTAAPSLKSTSAPSIESTNTPRAPENDSAIPNLVRYRLCNEYCINGEPVDNGLSTGPVSCKCFPGYWGSRCEKSLCENYCINGSCSVEEVPGGGAWQPKCSCPVGVTGLRCERDLCAGYCLNNGHCWVGEDGQPKCTCQSNGKGKRCELCPNLLEDVCRLLCSLDSSKTSVSIVQLEGKDGDVTGAEGPLCVCPPSSNNNEVYSIGKGNANTTTDSSSPTSYPIISPIFLVPVAICLVLLVIALFLAYKVMKLRRLPRIKKRIIVSKGSVPLAAGCGGARGRGSPGGGASSPIVEEQQQCEITIENCCNMNVCETPCFEPQLRSPGKSSSSKKASTKEEKKVLLGNMEVQKSSCGPCPGVDELY